MVMQWRANRTASCCGKPAAVASRRYKTRERCWGAVCTSLCSGHRPSNCAAGGSAKVFGPVQNVRSDTTTNVPQPKRTIQRFSPMERNPSDIGLILQVRPGATRNLNPWVGPVSSGQHPDRAVAHLAFEHTSCNTEHARFLESEKLA